MNKKITEFFVSFLPFFKCLTYVLIYLTGLDRAMRGRNLKELEGAISYVKRNGFEITLANELIEANKILLQVSPIIHT